MRDVQRWIGTVESDGLRDRIEREFALVGRLPAQTPRGPRKHYALHELDMDCFSKGKARKRCEFGCEVSVATTHRKGFVVGTRSMPGNPYDGHTLHEAIEQVEMLADARPRRVFVDRGYRGQGIEPSTGTAVFISGQRRGMTRARERALRRRSPIEPTIGYMKTDGRLSRSPLKGALGDTVNAVRCGAGHNIRLILAHLRALLAEILASLLRLVGEAVPIPSPQSNQATHRA
jgi:IS5 family transposase